MLAENPLFQLYANIIIWVLVGYISGKFLPRGTGKKLGQFLYWVGIPISIIAFMRKADLSGYILIAPLISWIAIIIGAFFAWIWIELGLSDERIKALSSGKTTLVRSIEDGEQSEIVWENSSWTKPTQGSFLLAMMVGNTAYLGFPVVLALAGEEFFPWAVLYNTLGTSLAVHGLGYLIANRFGACNLTKKNLFIVLLQHPGLWSFFLGIVWQKMPPVDLINQGLTLAAGQVVNLSLFMIGIQLSQLKYFSKLKQATVCLLIKMVLVPLIVGSGLIFFQITGIARLTLVLQMAMPPSFATVLYAQAYNLDEELTTTSVGLGMFFLLLTLPIWLFLFKG